MDEEKRTGHLVAVEVLDFGAACICRSVPTFRRNMLSPSSGAEVTGREVEGFIWDLKSKD
jgi:hypothetical protein